MPIATPPPDIDPTIVPPAHKQPTESETRETGVATEQPDPHVVQEKQITDLVKLWPQDRSAASLILAWQLAD